MILYIIPGFGETVTDYEWLTSKVCKKYKIKFLNFDLKSTSFKNIIETKIKKNSIVFGFSIGGLIAYKLKTPVEKGVYCSISNVLGVDAESNKKYITEIFGVDMAKEFLNMEYGVPNAKEYVVFCGDMEIDSTTIHLPNIEMVRNTGHEFTINYKQAVLNRLL